LFYDLPQNLLNRLRSIQNTAAQIVTLSKRFDHITPIMFQLHWLLLNYCIHFKILLLVYKCLNGLAPIYLSELLRYSNGPKLLCSSYQNFLAVPRSRLKTSGYTAFSVVMLLSYGINCFPNSGVLHLLTSSGHTWRHIYLNWHTMFDFSSVSQFYYIL